jgi:chromatin remodeling complex protein RSC6
VALVYLFNKNFMPRKPNAQFMKPMKVSADLAAVVGAGPMPRTDVIKKLWGYIKKHGLQDKKEKRMILADDKLKKVFGGKSKVSMFEMTKLVFKHLG